MSMLTFIARLAQLANYDTESRKPTAEKLSSCTPTATSEKKKKPHDCSRRYKQLMISFQILMSEPGMTPMKAPFYVAPMEEKNIITSTTFE
jgi:hypothetical protein